MKIKIALLTALLLTLIGTMGATSCEVMDPIVIGDSLSSGVPYGTWPWLLGWDSRAIGGATTYTYCDPQNVLGNGSHCDLPGVPADLTDRTVVVLLGSNNARFVFDRDGDGNLEPDTPEEYQASLFRVLLALGARGPANIVILGMPYAVAPTLKLNGFNQRIDQFHVKIQELCDAVPALTCAEDLRDWLGKDPANFAVDGLHTSVEGNKLIGLAAAKSLIDLNDSLQQ